MKLSIITVNLNNKDGLQKTIDSVISQTFKDFEWIVIDGGSTDGSKELIEQYSQFINYWVSEPDKGIYNAMNKGIRVAKGEYLQFLNSGDILIGKDVLKDFFRISKDKDVLFGNTITNKDGVQRRINYHNDCLSCYTLVKGTINHQSAFIKKALFEKYGLYDETLKIVSDWKFFFKVVIVHHCTVEHINKDIVLFDMSGVSSTNSKLLRKEREIVLKQFLPAYAIDDYLARFEINELLNHCFTKRLVGLLYRFTTMFEKYCIQ